MHHIDLALELDSAVSRQLLDCLSILNQINQMIGTSLLEIQSVLMFPEDKVYDGRCRTTVTCGSSKLHTVEQLDVHYYSLMEINHK